MLAVHVATYEPGSLVLLLSPSQRQSAELLRKAMAFYRSLGRPVASEAENAMSLTLESGSRIFCHACDHNAAIDTFAATLKTVMGSQDLDSERTATRLPTYSGSHISRNLRLAVQPLDQPLWRSCDRASLS